MRIGLLAMSGKPVHAGHIELIRLASEENDAVEVYVSLKDRVRPGEMPIYGKDMATVWQDHLLPILPGNTYVKFVDVPVRSVYERMGQTEESHGDDEFSLYSDPEDLESRFEDSKLKKYFPMLSNGQIHKRPVKRTDTVDVSGTKIRQSIADGNFDEFSRGMPDGIDKRAVWDFLSRHSAVRTPVSTKKTKKSSESILRSYIVELIKG